MSEPIVLTLPYPPSTNRYWRSLGSRVILSKEARDDKAQVGWLLNTLGLTPFDDEVSVLLKFYRPAQRGDLDNLIKVTLDSLIGWCYHDDKQVGAIFAYRFDDKDNPHVEVTIRNEAPPAC